MIYCQFLDVPTMQEYVTVVNASGYADQSDSGFLPCLVCPGPLDLNQSYTSLGEPLKYAFVVIN